jgi:Domain of unknown function (DUF6916)
MTFTRRKFLEAGVMSAIAAGFIASNVPVSFAQTSDIPIEAQRDPVFFFRLDTFKPYVGGFFETPNARGEMIAMRLKSAAAFSLSRTAKRLTGSRIETEGFTLLFEASAELPPFTSIHKIKHPSLGEFYLFLTHQKSAPGEFLYEAVFNRQK